MDDENIRARLYSNALARPILLTGLRGKEKIGEIFHMQMKFASAEGVEIDLAKLTHPRARAALLFVQGEELIRVIAGRIVDAKQAWLPNHASPQISVEFVPRAWVMSTHYRTEAYAGTAPDIIRRVMKRAMLAEDLDFELRLTSDYPEREFVLQHHETDLAFVSRLCEHWGIYFFFEHGKRDRLVFCDSNENILDVGVAPEEQKEKDEDEGSPQNPGSGDETIIKFTSFHQGAGTDVMTVNSLAIRHKSIPLGYITHDYNYRTPSLNLAAQMQVARAGDGLIIDYGQHFKTPDEGNFLAVRRAEALKATQLTYEGASNAPIFRAGGSIRLEDHPEQDFDFIVTEVEHELTEAGYTNRFIAQPKDIIYRRETISPKPRIAGFTTGIVVGTSPIEPQLDPEGRYEISLLFDAVDPGETRASRPIRMMQPHTGPDYGMHFPLKPGTEVAIAFINGDPDRPVIVGSLPNPITPSPVRGERSNTSRNIIKSMTGVYIEMDDDA